ncbi:hypothetical protein EZV62_008924 [Acer yangbiense]|uniref:Cathepsin propeptide inhibitor domain-containing protein n=1 Tax=Acer yangbiense TaxID=1000413 RepID=A0A5C7IF80_9ROSI|nr:hypothetical protein EZV62_008924 [Acer yangbiense]
MALKHEKAFVIPMLMVLVTLASHQATSRMLDVDFIAQKYEQWIAQHGRTYLNSTEKERRFQIFKKNYDHIEKMKMPPNLRLSNITASYNTYNNPTEVADSIDWREKDVETNRVSDDPVETESEFSRAHIQAHDLPPS